MVTQLDIEERRNKILELITSQGKVKVSALSKTFNVSEVSIRSDLAAMEEMGLLSRVHGGAVSTHKTYFKMSLDQRKKTNHEAKQAIANKVCDFVQEHDIIMINSGTTALLVYRALMSKFKNLTFVTNSIAIAQESRDNVIILGGKVNSEYQFTSGNDTRNQIKNYHADKAFLTVDGVTAGEGISSYYEGSYDIVRNMIKNSNTTYILADNTKIGRNAFINIDGVKSIQNLITNDRPNPEIEKLKKLGVKIIFV